MHLDTARSYVAGIPEECLMPGKRPNEPIGPTNVPGQSLDPKIYEDEDGDENEQIEKEQERREREESERELP